MKIIQDNAAYIQKHDLRQLLNIENYSIPASIINNVFGKEYVIIDQRNQFDFYKFVDPSEIEFFKNQDWIIDYNQVKDYTEEELISYGQSIADERNIIAESFNKSNNKDKRQKLGQQIELLEFKMYELRDVILFRKGKIKITLPEGIEMNRIKKQNIFKKCINKIRKQK